MSALRVRLRYWGFGRGVTGLVLAGVITGCQASESMSSMEATDVLSDVVDARTLFDGTWKLVRVERYDQRIMKAIGTELNVAGDTKQAWA